MVSSTRRLFAVGLATATLASAAPTASTSTSSAIPSQPSVDPRYLGGFEPVEDVGISAQQMFLGNERKVYIIDKTENNPITISGRYGTHPAWAVEYDIYDRTYRTMDMWSNTFCAGGAVLGNSSWLVVGGNQPVTTGGDATTTPAAYDDVGGGTAMRMLTPCTDQSCNWQQGEQTYTNNSITGGWLQMTSARWYPTVEILEDGSAILISGDHNGGYVNTAAQNNPTYEFFPPRGDGKQITLDWLTDMLPINLFPITWLLPSGLLFMQANRGTINYNITSQETIKLPDMPYAARVYPASAATAMLPLTPANNYTVTLLFCGGSNTTQWGTDGGAGYNVTAVPADQSCVRITPDQANPQYEDDDWMLEGRSMGEFVHLPDGTFWMGNGIGMGTAGYGNDHYSVGMSYGQDPIYMPAIYNPAAPKGSRWNRTGLGASTAERMYHSTAILLPDSSVLVAGSNPNADFTNDQWRSRTDADRWYPSWYNQPRPYSANLPSSLSYGGDFFNLTLATSLSQAQADTAKVVVIRNGFHTHAMGFGQRFLELETSYTIENNQTTLHVSQMPGNPGPTLFQPGPAMMFIVVDGVASVGKQVMIGSGQIETQPTADNVALPTKNVVVPTTASASVSAAGATGETSLKSTGAGDMTRVPVLSLIIAAAVAILAM